MEKKENHHNSIDSEKQNKESNETGELIRIFTLPKKIKQVKLAIAIAQAISGLIFIILPIIYFVNPQDTSTYIWILAALALLAGVILVGMSPTNIAKAINSKLILGERKISIRNSFNWVELSWNDIQEVLLTEKLSSDPNLNRTIGASMIKFRTISKGFYYFVDSYPIEEINIMKQSLKTSFELALEGTDYKVLEKHERPSIRIRFIFYERVPI